jgi:Tol biopolymer transport system component
MAPENSGIFRIDLKTGAKKLILPIAETLRVPLKQGSWAGAHHYFDHLLIAPDGKRIVFLQRWSTVGVKGFQTRMFTVNPDGTDLYLLDPYGKTSHFNWRDPSHLIVWTWQPEGGEHFYLFTDKTEKKEIVARDVLTKNGHITYLVGNRFLATDTAPDGDRKQHPALYDFKTGKLHELGAFYAAPEYTGVWRCDTTPRTSPDGRKIVVDSPHAGNGRQMYLFDVSRITGA